MNPVRSKAPEATAAHVVRTSNGVKEIEVEAKSAREAVAIALKKLRAKKDEAEIRILREETKGLFGMEGSRKAKVKVMIKKRK